MREVFVSNCEKSFVSDAIASNLRIDGRSLDEFRSVRIDYGSEYGSVQVCLGETKVLAQVTAEVTQPKATRPNEGLLHFNVEIGPMAAPNFEAGKSSDESVQINRIIERALKDSRCVDLESLCITADEKVWILRVDMNVLNHDGNVVDCASIAALAALAHFKRPNVTTAGTEVIIHSLTEKDPIPIVLHHYPVCISYAIYNDGTKAVADPTALEERIAEAKMVFGLNSYRELCGLHLGGVTLTNAELVLRSANRAAVRAKKIVDLIKKSISEDDEKRAKRETVNFTSCIRLDKTMSLAQDKLPIKLKHFRMESLLPSENAGTDVDEDDNESVQSNIEMQMFSEPEKPVIISLDGESAVLLPNEKNNWIPEFNGAESAKIDTPTSVKNPNTLDKSQTNYNSGSEEDDVEMLN